MKKKYIIAILIAVLGFGGIASAQVSTPNIWKIVSGAIRPVVSSWELGSATSRIQKGWFTSLDATSATIGSIAVSGTVSGDMVVGGQIRASNGTSTAPSYSFNSDTNTGMLWGGNDIIKFNNNGTTTLTIAANGQPKLGFLASSTANLVMSDTLGNLYTSIDNRITSATSPLVLATNNLSITKASSTANGYLSNTDWTSFNGKVSSQWATSGSNISYVAGSVGIGTTNPGATPATGLSAANQVLELKTATGTYINAIYLRRNDNATGLDITNEGAGTGIVYLDSRYNLGGSGGFQFRTNTAGTPQNSLRLDGNGNVGVGTTAPGAKLDISASNTTNPLTLNVASGGTDSNRALNFNVGGTTYGKILVPGGADAALAFWTGGGASNAERMRITMAGNVGIGTTGPTEKLEVNGNIKATGYKSSDGTIGTSTTINVRKADDSGACTITVKNGLVTATTCP